MRTFPNDIITNLIKANIMSEKNLSKLMKFLLIVSSLSAFAGALTMMQHYPVSNYFFSCGIISFLFLFLCIFKRNRLIRINKKLKEGKIVD